MIKLAKNTANAVYNQDCRGCQTELRQVRDFRGALPERTDKVIMLSTRTFTTDAKSEAIRDGATPIELVDGEKLVDMFSELSLGLHPKPDFDIDNEFFNEYR